MKILVLGGGIVGEGIIYALRRDHELVVADLNENRLQYLRKKYGIQTIKVNAAIDSLRDVMRGYDVVSGSLPGRFGMKVIKEACAAGTDLVDNSFMPEDFYSVEEKVKDAGITVVPDAGVAPGLSNIIVGHVYSKYGELDTVDIKVGGLPESNIPPLGYKVLFSPMDTLDEYTREVEVVKNGKVIREKPGEGIEYFFVNGLGSLEAFYTNGLRSLIRNVRARNMAEKTIRFRGHMEKIRMLMSLGLLDEEPIEVSNKKISPKEMLAALFTKNLSFPDIPDILYMEVNISVPGTKELRYKLFDRQDHTTGFSAMTRTTGFTNAAITDLVAKGMIKESGIVAPEVVAGDEGNFMRVINYLSSLGVKVKGSDIPE